MLPEHTRFTISAPWPPTTRRPGRPSWLLLLHLEQIGRNVHLYFPGVTRPDRLLEGQRLARRHVRQLLRLCQRHYALSVLMLLVTRAMSVHGVGVHVLVFRRRCRQPVRLHLVGRADE